MAKIVWNSKKLENLRQRKESFQGIINEIRRDRENLNQRFGAMSRSRADMLRIGNYKSSDIEGVNAEIERIEKDLAAVQKRYLEVSEHHKNVIALLSACETFLQNQKINLDPPGEFRGFTGGNVKTRGGRGL